MWQNPLRFGQIKFDMYVSTLIWQEHLLQDIPNPLVTLGGKKGVINYLRAQLPGSNLHCSARRGFFQYPLPPAIGDSYVFSYERWRNKREVSYASKSKVERNLRPPGWDRFVLPAFEKNLYREHIVTALRSASEVAGFRKGNEITVAGRAVPKPILSFDETDFPDCITKVLRAQGLGSSPTSVHAQCWPVVLSGRDLLAVAATSSENRFLAYVIPAVLHVRSQEPMPHGDGPIVLVLASTRELARQVQHTFSLFDKDFGIRTACLVPGEPKEAQLKRLGEGCEVWVATPSRLVGLMEECKVNIRRCTFLVLEQADRMLAMGLQKQLRLIVANVRSDRQTLTWLTSSTREASLLADEFMEDYVTVTVGETSQQSQNRRAEHIVYVCDEKDKDDRLVTLFEDILDDKRDKAVVFVETKWKVDDLVTSLRLRDWPAVGIHSRKTEQEREWALNALRFGRMLVLVATDMAGHGVDVEDARFVVNYDYPRSSDDYARRVKHAVRDDGKGRAYTFLTPTESRNAKELVRILRDAGKEVPPDLLKVAKKTARS
ncbi:probable ATP-dependent RNA helicase DDX5 [Rhipicephalus sanguineus]|uniref:probable ATP-dependent RNA helicase DDX5 n=1 Tax=Rhipicephalus sanguineus TaxID=34632 RepID=UPI0018958B2D|nr:probable ATP-dependent RNA helicase DDX5 [Rhipicephalus sanguineus]